LKAFAQQIKQPCFFLSVFPKTPIPLANANPQSNLQVRIGAVEPEPYVSGSGPGRFKVGQPHRIFHRYFGRSSKPFLRPFFNLYFCRFFDRFFGRSFDVRAFGRFFNRLPADFSTVPSIVPSTVF
jgi:hypothetical protein